MYFILWREACLVFLGFTALLARSRACRNVKRTKTTGFHGFGMTLVVDEMWKAGKSRTPSGQFQPSGGAG
jgi:hypothetical protein